MNDEEIREIADALSAAFRENKPKTQAELAVKTTSSPCQARLSTEGHSLVRVFVAPPSVSTATDPAKSPPEPSRNAIRSPFREKRGDAMRRPARFSKTTVPIGNSRRSLAPLPPGRRTTASLPSGAQSAKSTFSATSRGTPPARGTRASVASAPAPLQLIAERPSARASSPEEEIPMMSASGTPSARDSALSGRAVKTRIGSASHCAE